MPGVAAAQTPCANVRSANRTYGDKKRWTKRIKQVASSVSKKAERKEMQGCQARNLMAINEDVV
jgi:hypothetical protein